MKSSEIVLKYSFIPGAAYFLLVSIAHLFNIKVPVLFIYYNIESFAYQNKIISLLSFGWAAFFCTGYILVKLQKTKYSILHIAAGVFGILVFIVINLGKEVRALARGGSLFPYWLVVSILFLYLIWLIFFYGLSMRKKV